MFVDDSVGKSYPGSIKGSSSNRSAAGEFMGVLIEGQSGGKEIGLAAINMKRLEIVISQFR